MTDVQTLASNEIVLATCPVFVADREDVLTAPDGSTRDRPLWVAPEPSEWIPCGQTLELVATLEVVGDDYGSWANQSVGFRCGHTVEQMQESLRHADEI